MSSWVEVFTMWQNILTDIWNGIFNVEIFDGVTPKILILGLFVVFFSISIYRFFISNTHAELGVTTETTSTNMTTGKTSVVRSTRRRVH